MHTRVAEMLGVEFPIMAFSHCRDVVAAVTKAGGFGVLGAVAHTPQRLEIDLAWIDDHVAGLPYGVDLLLPSQHTQTGDNGADTRLDADTLRQLLPAEQQQFVAEILRRYEVPELPPQVERRVAGLSVAAGKVGGLLDVAFEHPIRLVASALGDPPVSLVERAHGAGVLVAALAGTAEHARRSAAKGVDLIVAQGTEAGGHTGEIATMVLVPEVIEAVAPIPVVAAGGIARGSQIAAALALGAEGVWMGSIWLTTLEAETKPAVKRKFVAASSSDTVRSRSLTGKPARMLRSAWTDAWDEPGAPAALPMPDQTLLVSQAQQRINRHADDEAGGAHALATYFVGQAVGSMRSVRPVRQVMEELVSDYVDAARRFVERSGLDG